ncbi:MAG: amino acid permease [Gammaproteobacteria bacterium]|nr:amino acid permease [Gammaproteobacteria bacterium]NNC97456.1 amino acid permease [Gammaproteobacteria bacterium]NNM12983.1 amino acid permease [Gammaproteobacteria bacterium]
MEEQSLKKELGLFDVYAISTGAMFSSGLFLLPGIAASYTGDSVWLAYLCAGFLILPAMYCISELSTAMPKAGGTYYFLDRAMGPLMGTIGGLGSWVAVVFKSAFALVGMGAYLGIYLNVPITITAIILTIAFGLVNIYGAKETTLLQRILVTTLVVILIAFVLAGLKEIGDFSSINPNINEPFLRTGLVGFISTIGLVFVSYAGLTKVASVAEEIKDPDRNIPLGMTLSLFTATIIYTLGTLVLINILEPENLYQSLTPVADAAKEFLGWIPFDLGVILIVVAAIAAFASTGNAGIMSASRYPYAMAKDKLVPAELSRIGKYGTPSIAIMLTVFAMTLVLVLFDVTSVAKLASAFQLLLFGLICIAVIVMRESRIPTYKPGFKAPFYPWLQIAGILISFWLIIEMGILAIGFTGMVLIGCVLWYQFYASGNMERRGAIFHVHERLGQQRYEGLEKELLTIIQDRTQAENLSYEAVISRSVIMDFRYGIYDIAHLAEILKELAKDKLGLESESIVKLLSDEHFELHPVSEGVQIAYGTHDHIGRPELFVLCFGPRTKINIESAESVHTLMFLIVPPKPVGLDLRLAGHVTEVIQNEHFEAEWLAAETERQMKEVLMRDDHYIQGSRNTFPSIFKQANKLVLDIELPDSCLIIMVEREGQIMPITPETVLRKTDEILIIGEPDDLKKLQSNGEVEVIQPESGSEKIIDQKSESESE